MYGIALSANCKQQRSDNNKVIFLKSWEKITTKITEQKFKSDGEVNSFCLRLRK